MGGFGWSPLARLAGGRLRHSRPPQVVCSLSPAPDMKEAVKPGGSSPSIDPDRRRAQPDERLAYGGRGGT